ncbi:MAG TPA: L-threonylcarbamoyladenylate synthase [Thermomicrobiales bacterium]|nr:L-threonylcarbamoyladenylate synthase [Thermomicrobiales bacterium]
MSDAQAQDLIERIAEALMAGAVAIIPTDTVYGIAAALDRPDAIERLYEIKGRPAGKPIPVLVDGMETALRLSRDFPDDARRLAAAFWPGALTIVVQAREGLPKRCLGPGDTVGLRMPDHADALALIRRCGGALAVTSANPSSQPETTNADVARRTLGVDLVLDAGETPGGVASTVVDVTGEQPRILRHGAIVEAKIRDTLSS